MLDTYFGGRVRCRLVWSRPRSWSAGMPISPWLVVRYLLVVSPAIRCYDDAGARVVTTAMPNGVPALIGRSGREPMSQTELVCRRSCMTIRTMAALAVIGATYESYEILGVDAT
jgi:hypothetical protein